MATIKVIHDTDVGEGLEVEGGKLQVKIDGASIKVNQKGEVYADVSLESLKGEEVHDLAGNRKGYLLKLA